MVVVVGHRRGMVVVVVVVDLGGARVVVVTGGLFDRGGAVVVVVAGGLLVRTVKVADAGVADAGVADAGVAGATPPVAVPRVVPRPDEGGVEGAEEASCEPASELGELGGVVGAVPAPDRPESGVVVGVGTWPVARRRGGVLGAQGRRRGGAGEQQSEDDRQAGRQHTGRGDGPVAQEVRPRRGGERGGETGRGGCRRARISEIW